MGAIQIGAGVNLFAHRGVPSVRILRHWNNRKHSTRLIVISRSVLLCYIAIFGFLANVSNADQFPVAVFSQSSREGWNDKVFAGTTFYQLHQIKGKNVLKAESQGTASGLIKKIRVDLKKYPYLNWSWSIENRLDTKNERIKSGDDYAARIYVVVDGGIFLWRTRAVNYVWANEASKGEIWQNPFAGKRSMMVALRNSQDKTSTWYIEKRNVYADLKRLFGADIGFIDAVALMTDTDNSHGQVVSYYGDIYFSEN